MNPQLILLILAVLPGLPAAAAPPETAPSTQPAVESKEVEKDSVAITARLKRTTIPADEQPEFIVRFRNVGKEQYRNLYDVTAYWNWTINLINTDPRATNPGPWRLQMNAIPYRAKLEHRQIKPGESTDVIVNLNDPPFTFNYVYAGDVNQMIPPVRRLPPGRYQMTTKVELTSPFGPGYFQWSGPATTTGVELTITGAPQKKVTKEEQDAYDAGIARITEKFDSSGLWTNGLSIPIDLPNSAKPEDVIDAAVNSAVLDSKAYRVLTIKPFTLDRLPGEIPATAALLQVGKSYQVVFFSRAGAKGWWSRFYDTEVAMPPTSPPGARREPQPKQ
jgi:hypothetical protein